MHEAAPEPRLRKGDATREAIIQRALAQAVEVGLEGLSLGVLAVSLDLSKSGLFAHFKSKEALQLAVLEEAIERFAQRVIVPALAAPRGEPRVQALFERHLDWVVDNGFGSGCLFMALTQEYDDRPGAIRERLIQSQREWREVIAKAVSLAIRERHFAASVDPAQFAFEAVGIATAFQQAHKLFGDPGARERARRAFGRLVEDSRSKKKG
jgi:AcrR family transcriptional regulator